VRIYFHLSKGTIIEYKEFEQATIIFLLNSYRQTSVLDGKCFGRPHLNLAEDHAANLGPWLIGFEDSWAPRRLSSLDQDIYNQERLQFGVPENMTEHPGLNHQRDPRSFHASYLESS
jgi:hypothetical protein